MNVFYSLSANKCVHWKQAKTKDIIKYLIWLRNLGLIEGQCMWDLW